MMPDLPSIGIHRRAARALTMLLAAALIASCGRPRGALVRVTIPAGATLADAADSLARAGVIRSARLFRMYALVKHEDRSVKAGTYLLVRSSSWSSALEALSGGKGIVHVVTIPEGYSLGQILPLLSGRLGIPPESLDVAVRDTALLHRLDVPAPTLEGYLFPDTYLFPDHTTARRAVATMVRRFEQVWRPEWTARLDSIPLSRNDVVTLASIVEKEARLPEERPVIAAVYMNRLRDHMLLQADPTVQYALGQHQARVLYRDLAVSSPYNTYRHPGLPPGPIASPGRASLLAALYPANVPYKYFVALPDGHHEFRVDFAGHSEAKRAARHAWDSLAPRAAAPRRPARKHSRTR
ncbi:MAG TPA: endolytic transglycosylase MltG [Gemmatimonadaceae bacterium]|nr:endolytic transglycosylase MltG [Gemmatimonadaceae bacterium]